MDSILQSLLGQLAGETLNGMSQQLGADNRSVEKAIGLALPMLLGSLNRNASSSDGAKALANALSRDHDGSILDDLQANLGRQELVDDGYAILGHVLGDKRGSVGGNIGRASGLNAETTTQLISMLAPVVLGALGQAQRKQSLDAGGVASMLAQEHRQASSQVPGIAQLLDMDADGDISDELITLGGNLLGGLLSKK